MRRALYIGRFQPFHNGHFDCLWKIRIDSYFPVILIGSANAPISERNPFTLDERRAMIKLALAKDFGDSFEIHQVDDIGNYPVWVEHILKSCPDLNFDILYSGSPIVRKLFEDKGHKTAKLHTHRDLSASYLRELIYYGFKETPLSWYVPKPVADYIEKINGVQRIIDLYNTPKVE